MSNHSAIPRTQFPLRLPVHIRAGLDAYATHYGLSVNAAACELISRALAYEIVYEHGLDATTLGGPHGDTEPEPHEAPERPGQHVSEAA